MRNTEPKSVQDVIFDVMTNLKNRSNINYYTPEMKRETAAAEPAPMRKIDFEVGDVVQIRANAKEDYIGRVGVIIGIRYKNLDTGPALVYTVKFSDKDGADFLTDHFNFIRSAEPGEF